MKRFLPLLTLACFGALVVFADTVINYQATDGSIPRVTPDTPLPVTLGTTPAGTSTKATLVSGYKIPAATATPEAVAAAGTYVQSVTIFAQRATQGTANTSSLYVDWTSGNGTQLIEIPVGGFQVITAPPGKYLDLGDIYVDSVTAGDGVLYRGFR